MSPVFFFLFAAMGAMTPFLSLHYRSVGLTATQISLLLSVTPVLLFISQPLFGPLTDRSGHRGRMLAYLLVAVAATGMLIGLGSTFWTLLASVVIWAFVSGPLVPIADSIALGEVVRTGVSYPQLRLWGSVGFVLTTTLLGRLYSSIDLRWAFAFYAGINLIAFLFARRLPSEGISGAQPVWPALKALLKRPQPVAFLLVSCMLQTTQAAHSSFFSIHAENLGGTMGEIGLGWAAAAVVEVPVWLVLARVTERTGPLPLLAFSGVMYGLRWFLFSIAPNAVALIWFQLLAAFSFAVFMPTAVVMMGDLVPPAVRTSGQALLVLVNGGIATVLGNLAAGHIVDLAGTGAMYRTGAYIATAAGVAFFLLFRRARQSANGSASI